MTKTTEVLKSANLRYTVDTKPGFFRQKKGKEFAYYDLEGSVIKDKETIERINKLAIPPAWEDVWVSPYADGHLQATGKDARNRKQYRYHPLWNEKRQAQKFYHILDFAKVLPKIRRKVRNDMNKDGLPREKVIATIIYLLDNTLIRVGNEEYAEENKSYGLTTLKTSHVDIVGSKIRFEFKGKSNVYHSVSLQNKKVASVIAKLQELPGQDLFEYIADDGTRQKVSSEDVNDYLKAIAKFDITAKDFRTWAGTNLAAKLLDECGCCDEEKEIKKTITQTVKGVSSKLRNKPNTCRKYYIHPSILESYSQGMIVSQFPDKMNLKDVDELDEGENRVLKMLTNLAS